MGMGFGRTEVRLRVVVSSPRPLSEDMACNSPSSLGWKIIGAASKVKRGVQRVAMSQMRRMLGQCAKHQRKMTRYS